MNCPTVIPGQPLKYWQKIALNIVAKLDGGRDLVFAIDLTDSVGLNAEGRIRLRQIIENSLRPGDTVYIVPFASDVYSVQRPIKYEGKKEDIDKILATIPLHADQSLKNSDIQQAELSIYQQLAQFNQCSLHQNQPIKPQSVVWITDAPLLTNPGISSNIWIETPANSPFRQANSLPSQERKKWVETLPLNLRSQTIISDKGEPYKLSVVDIDPTVQEFCTPSPGGQETCLVTPYIIKQLWLPTSILTLGIIAMCIFLKNWLSWQKNWQLRVNFLTPYNLDEEKVVSFANKKRIFLGGDTANAIQLPDGEYRGYLERKRNAVFFVPEKDAPPIVWKGKEIIKRTQIIGHKITLTTHNQKKKSQEIDIVITIKK